MSYEHTQTGLMGPVVFVPMALIFLVILVGANAGLGGMLGIGAFFLLLGGVMVNFSRLTIRVDDDDIRLCFGWGWPRRQIALAEITGVGSVRNLWWYGFGVRLTPHGWLYNVWGLDAVEVRLSHGKTVRIGSDESRTLASAIQASIGSEDQ